MDWQGIDGYSNSSLSPLSRKTALDATGHIPLDTLPTREYVLVYSGWTMFGEGGGVQWLGS